MPVDAFAADLWALACCLYCFVFGRLPFVGSCVVGAPHMHAPARHSSLRFRPAAVLHTALPEYSVLRTSATGTVRPLPPVRHTLFTSSSIHNDACHAVAPSPAPRWTSTAPS